MQYLCILSCFLNFICYLLVRRLKALLILAWRLKVTSPEYLTAATLWILEYRLDYALPTTSKSHDAWKMAAIGFKAFIIFSTFQITC